MDKIWQVAERLAPDLKEHLLYSRGLLTPEQQQHFFHPTLEQLLSPSDFPDMDMAVERIIQAVDRKEHIVVWGDFDADGVTATAILWETLHQLGADAMPYIPARDSEGHGFSDQGLAKIAKEGTKLIITVDHGITALDEIVRAKKLGMEVIVTDHHEPVRVENAGIDAGHDDYSFPDAVAVIHPFRLTKPQMLAGCGVAYMVAYAIWLENRFRNTLLQVHSGNPTGTEGQSSATTAPAPTTSHWLVGDTVEARREFAEGRIELAAIGTIADMMPLTKMNRSLAALGLISLGQTKRVGLRALYGTANISQKVSMYDVGFLIAPRLNAPGRLGHALDSLRLLCTKEQSRAFDLANTLNAINNERQVLLERVAKEALKLAEAEPKDAFVLYGSDWPAGVCGLAAGKVVERFYRPAVIMEDMGELCRGSARSIKGFDITAALASMADLLEGFGGHAMAAGFTAKKVHIAEIERRMGEMVRSQLNAEQLQPTLMIDAEVELAEISEELYQWLEQFEPCGMGNPGIVFVAREVKVKNVKVMGKEGKHLRFTLQKEVQATKEFPLPQKDIEAIAFNFGDKADELSNSRVDVAFNLDKNEWNGRATLQLKVKDVKNTTP